MVPSRLDGVAACFRSRSIKFLAGCAYVLRYAACAYPFRSVLTYTMKPRLYLTTKIDYVSRLTFAVLQQQSSSSGFLHFVGHRNVICSPLFLLQLPLTSVVFARVRGNHGASHSTPVVKAIIFSFSWTLSSRLWRLFDYVCQLGNVSTHRIVYVCVGRQKMAAMKHA